MMVGKTEHIVASKTRHTALATAIRMGSGVLAVKVFIRQSFGYCSIAGSCRCEPDGHAGSVEPCFRLRSAMAVECSQ